MKPIESLLFIVAIGTVASVAAGLQVLRPELSTAQSTEPGLSNGLDAFPGFGKSSSAALRDDTIALWEAFNREQRTEQCMGRAGFEYIIDVAFPAQPIKRIAQSLDVGPSESAAVSPAEANRQIRSLLTPELVNDYYLALYGETRQAMAEFEANEGVSSNEQFAMRGCVSAALAEVGSIWTVRNTMEAQLAEIRRDTLSKWRAEYQECARFSGVEADHPGIIESRLRAPDRDGNDLGTMRAAFAQCSEVWRKANETAEKIVSETLVAKHPDVFERLSNQYAGVMEKIRSDNNFQAYLSEALARAGGGG